MKIKDVLNLFSKKQIDSINESYARINIWEGAVRSGKTYASLWRFLFELANGPAGDYAIITRTLDSYKRNIDPQLKSNVGCDVRYYSGKREVVLWGKTVHIISANDERAESKIRGCTLSGAYVDEATIIPESIFRMLLSRCTMGGARIFVTTNPDSPYHWFKRDFLTNNPDVKSWQFLLDDNPKITQGDKDFIIRQHKGLYYQRFILGLWVQAEGAIYDFFDPLIHVIDFPPAQPEYFIVGVDYGTTNPCSFTLIGINRSKFPNYWVEDVYYFDSKIQQRQKTDTEYAIDLAAFIKDRPIKAIYVDPSAASFKAELYKHDISNVYDAENEVIDGIRLVGKYLNNGTLKVCRKCDALIKEFQSYVWDPKCAKTGVDKPLKQNDHCLTGDTIVLTNQGYVRIDSLVGTVGMILSDIDIMDIKIGMEEYTNVRMTRENADIYELQLEDGTTIKSTNDHMFLTLCGWKRLCELTHSDTIYTWNTNSFKILSFTKTIKRAIGLPLNALKKGCMWLFGNLFMVKSLKDTTFII